MNHTQRQRALLTSVLSVCQNELPRYLRISELARDGLPVADALLSESFPSSRWRSLSPGTLPCAPMIAAASSELGANVFTRSSSLASRALSSVSCLRLPPFLPRGRRGLSITMHVTPARRQAEQPPSARSHFVLRLRQRSQLSWWCFCEELELFVVGWC